MAGRWEPSIADQLEDVADSLLEAAYAVAAIAEQLREKPTRRGKDGAALSKQRHERSKGHHDGRGRAARSPRTGAKL